MKSESTEQTRNLVQQFIQSLTGRKLENLVRLFREKVDWFIPGNQELAPWLGQRKTKQEIREFFTLLWNSTEPVSAQIDHVLAADNFAVVVGEFSTRMLQTGKIVNSIFSIHITVEDNLIVKYRLQEDSYAVSIALTR
jgi:ketosteroid isomerase-like protein